VLLSARNGSKTVEFEITIHQLDNPERLVFRFCDREFFNLDELIRYFSNDGNFIEAGGSQFRLLHPIYRGTCKLSVLKTFHNDIQMLDASDTASS